MVTPTDISANSSPVRTKREQIHINNKKLAKQGRPPVEFKEEYNVRVIELGKEGKTIAQMAASIGISKQLLYDWEKNNESFMDSMRVARTYQEAAWDTLGEENMDSRTFNSRMFELYRGNMHDWGRNIKNEGTINHVFSLKQLAEASEPKEIESEVVE